MGNNTELDFKLISEKCGLFSKTDVEVAISKIDTLKNEYSEKELINIYYYVFDSLFGCI